MRAGEDWSWKLREAVDQIKTRYEHIGGRTGVPFLAVVYPPDAEPAVFKEWNTLIATLRPQFEVKTIDVLAVTMSVVDQLGGENIVNAMTHPMPGGNPEAEFGQMCADAVAEAVRECRGVDSAHTVKSDAEKRVVVVLEHLAALCPVTTPRRLMQTIWSGDSNPLDMPIIFLIPGTLLEKRVYAFVNRSEEFMYRGDIL